ncbi:MAG: hypothetical protein N3A61_02615, partial [Ignavibacteria bacterium]|nr:hypothetical protein [Ignavibacteria bacterium]
MKNFIKVNLVLSIILTFFYLACERPTSPPNPNLPPNTTLANVPRDGDTLFALQTLHWDGEDDDGYVVSYQYRYITYRYPLMDSLVQEWKDTKATSLTIAFVSDSSLNKQVFQIRAVDNNGAVDPTPAEKIFYTRKNRYPITEIFKPTNNQQLFVTDKITDWWPGVELVFAAHDPDEGGDIVEYAWSVDNNYT